MAITRRKAASGGFHKGFAQFIPRLFGRLSPRLAMAVILGLVIVAGVSYAWQRWGTAVTRHPRYLVSPENIEVPAQPNWIRSDVKAEAFRDGSLGQLSSLDPQVTVKVAHAFTGHTWVARVKRVAKEYPARIVVELEYRRPVGMVVVADRDGRPGVIPVDSTGVVLPPGEFTPRDDQAASPAKNYLRIEVGETVPLGVEGTLWGDERVHGAAQIAAVLADRWSELGLFRVVIAPSDVPVKKLSAVVYELGTREGTRVIWGHAPGLERGNEITATEKVARLARYVEQYGTLAKQDGPASIDLRDKDGVRVSPRTARR